MRKLLFVPLVVMCLAVLPKPAEAAIIQGVLDIEGAVKVTATEIDWLNPEDGGFGDAEIQVTSTGSFAALAGTTDRLLDLNIAVVAGAGLPVDFFQTLLAEPTWNFRLEDVLSCGELGPQVTCAFGAASPFGFVETAGQTTVIMIMTGIVFDTTTPALVSEWTGIFTAQFNQTIASLVNEFLADEFIDTSFSASKITVRQVPEPASLGLLGIGLLGIGMRARRRI